MDKNSFEAQLLHTPFDKEDAYHSLSMPVYNTAAYEFDTAEAMEEAFCGRTADHAYSRITNPTVQYFEKRIRTITGIAPGTVVTIRDGVIHTGITHIGDIPVGIIRTGAVEAVIIPTGPTGLIGQDNGQDSEAE